MKYMLFRSNFVYNLDEILVGLSSGCMYALHTFDPMCFAINQATSSSYQGKSHSWIRINQVGRDLVQSVVQPLGEISVGYGVRPGSSGLCPVRSWKPPRTEAAQPHWQPAAPLASAFGGKLFLVVLFQLLPVVSPPATSEPHHSTSFLVHPFLNCSPV